MVAAFRDEEHYRRLLKKHGMEGWQVLPRLWLQTLDRDSWPRHGHALRLMVAREHMLDGTVEVDHFYLGGRPRKHADDPPPGRGRKGQVKTEKTPVMAIVQRPADITPGSTAGDARAAVVTGLSLRATVRAVATQVELRAHLMSDEAKAFVAIGESFAAHETCQPLQPRICPGCCPRQFS